MEDLTLVYPMFAMVLLTFFVLLALFRTRTRFVREGKVDASYFKTYQKGSEPVESAKLARHFANIFEAPTLFYVVCLAAMFAESSGTVFVALAWTYVGIRAAHAYIHTGANKLEPRIAAYFSGWLILLAMWLHLVVTVALR